MLYDKEVVLVSCNIVKSKGSRLVLTYRDRYTGKIDLGTVRLSYYNSFSHEEVIDNLASFDVIRIYFPDQVLPSQLLSFCGRREVAGIKIIVDHEGIPF